MNLVLKLARETMIHPTSWLCSTYLRRARRDGSWWGGSWSCRSCSRAPSCSLSTPPPFFARETTQHEELDPSDQVSAHGLAVVMFNEVRLHHPIVCAASTMHRRPGSDARKGVLCRREHENTPAQEPLGDWLNITWYVLASRAHGRTPRRERRICRLPPAGGWIGY